MRTLSTAALAELNAQGVAGSFLILITIDHDVLDAPIRVSSDAVNTVSRGETFIAFPFELKLPDDTEDASPRARLSIDNVDRQIVLAVRSLPSAPSVLVEIVRAADVDTVEAHFEDFLLTNITYDAHLVEGDLTVEDFTQEPFPAGTFSPSLFPGLF